MRVVPDIVWQGQSGIKKPCQLFHAPSLKLAVEADSDAAGRLGRLCPAREHLK